MLIMRLLPDSDHPLAPNPESHSSISYNIQLYNVHCAVAVALLVMSTILQMHVHVLGWRQIAGCK